MSRQRRFALLAAAAVTGLGAAQVQQANAQFVATRFNGPGGGIGDGQNAVHNNPVAASNVVTAANWQDDGGTGGPNDFNAGNGNPDNPIPGDQIGVDENEWAVVGSGVFVPAATGMYRFRTGTDDSSRVILAGRNVVVQPGCCNNDDGANQVPLTAGQRYPINTIVKEGGGGGSGEFSVSFNGGAFELLGAGASHAITPNIGTPSLVNPAVVTPGLTAKIYSPTVHPNQNRDTDAFLAGNPTPAVVQTATSTNSGPLPENTVVTAEGFVRIDAGDDLAPGADGIQVKFVLDTDDNGVLHIAGLRVMENDGGHGTNHLVSENEDLLSAGTGDNAGGTQVVTFPSPGLYDLFAYAHNGGGGGSGNVLSSIGGVNGSMISIPSDRLFVPEPGSIALLGLGGLGLLARRRRAAR